MFLFCRRTFLAREQWTLNGPRLLAAAAVQAPDLAQLSGVVGGDGVRGQPGNGNAAAHATDLARLDGESLAHDGAAMGEQLQLGDGAATRRGGLGRRAGRRRQGAQRGGRGLLQEGAHGLGLPKNSVHDGFEVAIGCL